MCTNTRLVHNRYTGKMVRVACGKCEACQQKKATLRANRIRNNSMYGFVPLFVTLTYDNMFVPYLKRSELVHGNIANIYRDCSVRWYKDKMIIKNSPEILGTYSVPETMDFYGLQDLVGKKDCIGVIYVKDAQDFIKRLRTYFFRNYGIQLKLSFFCCHEYGGDTYRPHAHYLLYVRSCDEEKVRSLLPSCWSFDFRNPKRFRTEVARNAASYVASYVNSGNDFPALLKEDSFRQRTHQSKTFGVGLHCFMLTEILKKAYFGDLSYNREVTRNGVTVLDSFLIPEYVINRYFPIFKGYCRFTDSEIFSLLRLPKYALQKLTRGTRISFRYNGKQYVIDDKYNATKTEFRDIDFHRFIVRQKHAIDFYISQTGKTEYDYAIDYIRVWNLYHSTVLKHSYFDDNGNPITDWSNFYENISDVDNGLVRAPTLHIDSSFVRDPNSRFDIVQSSENLKQVYHKMSKNKHVVNYALSHQGYNV